ncbi:MAG: GGDEF domain-containing protein [Acidobacteriota bacterium]
MSRHQADKTVALQRPKLDSGRLRKAHASLVVLEGAEIGRDFRLRRASMLIGRGLESDIRVLDDLASREHARVECVWDPRTRTQQFRLIDLDSTNHTYLNSRRIERAELRDGDKIQIGETVLKFVLLDDVDARFHEEVRNRISYDRLTGLLTRESLFLALGTELKRCQRYGLPLAVLMMDLDRFKTVNDTHGHLMGSHVLAEVGRLIRESLRGADVAGRYGGEEFIAYLAETGPEALKAAERVRRAIASHPFSLDGRTIGVTISIGIARFPDHGGDLRSLVARADRALYEAKESGRDRVCLAAGG